MNFASWRKCDFQVHTPRDPNWSGARPLGKGDIDPTTGAQTTDQKIELARAQWATEFVQQCVDRELQAIAITDHHEMVMVRYVHQAIADRRNADSAFDLCVFPGMELTASGGKQCIIIFDADLSEEWWRQAQGKLGIVYADLDERTAKGLKTTQLTSDYADIGALLDELTGLKGRYIILPNVSQGNRHTVLTNGAHGEFRRMPYVGGYLDEDQTINTLSATNRARLSGTDKTWSEREIYPLPTSDCRTADYRTLGKNNAWIKLAEPTAEGIRQAFLSHRSRIAIEPPQTPALVVADVKIQGSTILHSMKLLLSPEFNAIIGGRGSGKSSFLEYVAFGLGRSCYDVRRDHYSGTERMHDLINDTLVTKGGSIELTVIQDKAAFKVLRGPMTSYQPQVVYPNGASQTITVKELRALFPAVVYSQGELAEIGKQAGKKAQLSDLLQFVNPDFKRDDDQLNADIEAARSSVRSAVQALAAHWLIQVKLRGLTTSRDSHRQRVDALQKTLPMLSEDDQATVDHFDRANDFDSKRLQASKHADQMIEDVSATAAELLNERDLTANLLEESEAIRLRYRDLYLTFAKEVKRLDEDLKSKRLELTAAEDEWAASFKKARTERDRALEKLSTHKTATTQIIKLREEITSLTNQIADIEADLRADGDRSSELTRALSALRQSNDRRAERTQEWAREIEQLSSGKIKARVDVGADISELKDAIDVVASKTGSQEATRVHAIEEALASASAWDVLDRVRTDCLSILYWRQVGAATGEQMPVIGDLMNILGNTERIRESIKERIDVARLEAIATAVPKPQISLTYCDGAREISFEKASEGQRAAALLFMLLEQQGGPLLIDQPEGDLDNKIISELTDKLHTAKQKRQLLFASHNANIVVNGSSELVGHLDIKAEGDRYFDCAGAIDSPSICKVITSTMEGGEKAFKDRQSKYGY